MKYGNVNAYSYKFKKLLTAVALGMRPATEWDGIDEASGELYEENGDTFIKLNLQIRSI